MKKISILGSTGSIGQQTLDVVSQHPDKFRVVGLTAGENIQLLAGQIREFKPDAVSVRDKSLADSLREMIDGEKTEILHGQEGNCAVAGMEEAEQVVSSIVGASGLLPTLTAVKAGKDIALANKESLVVAGEIITREAERHGSIIIPVDSEHSAIFQALECGIRSQVKRIILTASGGPFLNASREEMEDVPVEVALRHPTWKMGSKITIDSATLMNKGFEVIEARWLFGFSARSISVWIHPQSIVHSMVEYIDGSLISQMSKPDMRIPIAYALTYPERIELNGHEATPGSFGELTFAEVDPEKFPSIPLAFSALEEGGTMPSVMNGANEVAVHEFLSERLCFTGIVNTVEKVMGLHKTRPADSLEAVLESDAWARETALAIIRN